MADYRELMCGDILEDKNGPFVVDHAFIFNLAIGKYNRNDFSYIDIDYDFLKKNFDYDEENDFFVEGYYPNEDICIKRYICDQWYDAKTNTIEYTYSYEVTIHYDDNEEPAYTFPEIFFVHELQHLYKLFINNKVFKI